MLTQLHVDIATFLLIFILQFCNSQFYCAEQIQACWQPVADVERQIAELQRAAFELCVTRTDCRMERVAFDKCFFDSLRVSNSIPTSTLNGESEHPFSEIFIHFRSALDSCFLRSPFSSSHRPIFAPLLVDDDALYMRSIFTSELSSRLWSLPELNSPRPSLDALAICHVDNFNQRLFGGGNAYNQKPGTSNSTCLLEESELVCYRDALDRNSEYLQLIYSRDFSLRTCLRNLRTNSVCRNRDHSRLRGCICTVKAELEDALQMAMLSCVQKEKMAVLVGMQNDQSAANRVHVNAAQTVQSSSSLSNNSIGTITADGQCKCSCGSDSISPAFPPNAPRFIMPSDANEALWDNSKTNQNATVIET